MRPPFPVCAALLALVFSLALPVGVCAESISEPSAPPAAVPDRIDRKAAGKIVSPYSAYSYSLLMQDIRQLQKRYPSLVRVQSLGETPGGRVIPLLVVGSPSAPRCVWVDASLHAREYMTSQVVMSSLELLLGNAKKGVFEGKALADVLQNVSLHVAPMLNPDGVELSRHGISSAPKAMREALIALNGGTDFRAYKANLLGVDLNRNFPAGWPSIAPTVPSSIGYKGTAPLSEIETAAVARYLQSRTFSLSVSFHCTGGEIYWHYNQQPEAFSRDFVLASGFSALTGYPLVPPDPAVPVGGLKDYVVDTLCIPAITIELRSPRPAPIPQRYFKRIFDENALVLWHALNLFG